jgi:hypothetical protein
MGFTFDWGDEQSGMGGILVLEIRPAADLNEMMKASEQRRRQNIAR